VRLETGRKHQIRVHLSERGWPIVGDRVYGRKDDPAGLRLRAVVLGFVHPRTGRDVRFAIARFSACE
jgi:23S rRNA pseudouridine1911/1915/1917 synthase